MEKEIAVLLDKDMNLTKFAQANLIKIFKREDKIWKVSKEIPVNNVFEGALPKIRQNLFNLQQALGACKIIVGSDMTGIVFNVFDQAGFIISELQSFDETMLETIYMEISNELLSIQTEKEKNSQIPTKPYETDIKGHYYFDFSLLKDSSFAQSSKSTIIPFLNTTPFKQLEIICDHVMPWFDFEMQKRSLTFEVFKKENGKSHIIIKSKYKIE